MRRRPPRFTRSDILFPYTTLCRSATAHLPVIFMTGLTETADVLRGLEAGGVDYVTKPLVLEVLVARIAVHLGNARLARRALAALDHAGKALFDFLVWADGDDILKIGRAHV